jgi:hypothetical protein
MATNESKIENEAPRIETGEPVPGFPLKFKWYTGDWERIFDRQIELIKTDVARARSENRLVVYLSCPISSRGGGWSGTNVDVARHIERILLQKWGEAFWILNPAQYQMESKAGLGLLNAHANALNIDLATLTPPEGGDYMRMWTKILVEDGIDNLGRNFDAYYFIGPRDVLSFFSQDETLTLTSGIEAYFSRKFEADPSFRDEFSIPGIEWGNPSGDSIAAELRERWSKKRFAFLRYYGLRASANFSLGSHDEWAILRLLNSERRRNTTSQKLADGDTGDQIAAYFDGIQVDPSASQAPLSRGYAI